MRRPLFTTIAIVALLVGLSPAVQAASPQQREVKSLGD